MKKELINKALKLAGEISDVRCNGEVYKDYNGYEMMDAHDLLIEILNDEIDLGVEKGKDGVYKRTFCAICSRGTCEFREQQFVGYLI